MKRKIRTDKLDNNSMINETSLFKSPLETHTKSVGVHSTESPTIAASKNEDDFKETKLIEYISAETQTIINSSKYLFSTVDPETETTVKQEELIEKLFNLDSKD